MDHQADQSSARGAFLSAMLILLGGSFILFFMFLVCGGLAIGVLAVVAGLAAFGFFHYLLWGHSFTREVAGEREEMEIREQMEELPDHPGGREWTPEERSWYRRF
jgi:hypothetical protein